MGGSGSKSADKSKGASPAKAGKKAPPPKKEITPHEKAVLDLKNQRDRLHKYRKQVLVDHDVELEPAWSLVRMGLRPW